MKKIIYNICLLFTIFNSLNAQKRDTFEYDKNSYYKAAYDTLQNRLLFTKKNYNLLSKNEPAITFYNGNIESIEMLPIPVFKFKSKNNSFCKKDNILDNVDFKNNPKLQFAILYLNSDRADIINLQYPFEEINSFYKYFYENGSLINDEIIISIEPKHPTIKIFTIYDFYKMNQDYFIFNFLYEDCIVIDGTTYVIQRYSPDFKGVYDDSKRKYIKKGFIIKDNMALFEINYFFKKIISKDDLMNKIERSLNKDDEN